MDWTQDSISSRLFIPLGSRVWPLSIRYASLALSIVSRDEGVSSSGTSSMSLRQWLSEKKWSETAVGLEEGVGLSTVRRCSLERFLSRLFVSPMYCLMEWVSNVFLLILLWTMNCELWTVNCELWHVTCVLYLPDFSYDCIKHTS